jgi:nucleoside-diphosphate-sugar epimerase
VGIFSSKKIITFRKNYAYPKLFFMKKILVVGAGGQIGSELVPYLRSVYGAHNVVATDVRECRNLSEDGPFEVLDALNPTNMASVVARYNIDTIFNLVALLSAVGEKNPQMAWGLNMGALLNALEVARQHNCAVLLHLLSALLALHRLRMELRRIQLCSRQQYTEYAR